MYSLDNFIPMMNSELYEFNSLFLEDKFSHENHIEFQKYSNFPNIFEESPFPLQDLEASK